MSRPILKTLIFALCLALGVGSALPASALEIQYNYCRDFADDQKATCQSILSELKPISRDDLLEANKLAVDAVEQQIPKFNVLKEFPYAKTLVNTGAPCRLWEVPNANPWNIFCGPGNAKIALAQELAGVTVDIESQDPAYEAMMSKTFKELIDLGKADAKYTSDDDFRTMVNTAEQNYNVGMSLLREMVLYFDESANVDVMASAELIAAIEALPEYNAYNLEFRPEVDDSDATRIRYLTGLYATYAIAKYEALYEQEISNDIDYGDQGIYNSMINAYTDLVTAATAVDPNFKVDLSSLQKTAVPTAPDTGSTAAELSAAIVSVALSGIAVLAGTVGIIRLSRLYLFSPLKRRK